MSKGKFVSEVTGRINGEGAEIVASKVGRKAKSAFEGQIAALKAELVDNEGEVEDAKEALGNAIYPTTTFTDNKTYCQNVSRAQEAVDRAIATQAATQESIEFFEKMLAENF